jgi:precorrin-6B methylase 2
MKRFREAHVLVLTAAILALATGAAAQGQKPFQPEVGQPGKDVVWVPTCQPLVDQMLDMAKLTPKDTEIDLGSGDGRTVITAAKRGATAIGVEFNPDMVKLSQDNAAKAGVTDKATFVKGDLFEYDFSKANVISMFLLPSINMKLRPKILDLTPGTRIVTNTFTMEDWDPDQTVTLEHEDCSSWRTANLWIVPAKVQGTWKLGQGELVLNQTFQKLTGTYSVNGGAGSAISDASMRGAEIIFTAGGTKYTGIVNGNAMQGTNWTATKIR